MKLIVNLYGVDLYADTDNQEVLNKIDKKLSEVLAPKSTLEEDAKTFREEIGWKDNSRSWIALLIVLLLIFLNLKI